MNPSARSGRKSPKFARLVKQDKIRKSARMFENLELGELEQLDEDALAAFYDTHPVIPEDASWETYYCSED